MRDWSDILDEGSASLERWLSEAFEAGRAAGRQEGVAEVKAKLAGLLDDGGPEVTRAIAASANVTHALPAWLGPGPKTQSGGRAPPNSVKPTIVKLVHDAPGLTREEIATRTGFKFNSVRGTLWTLSNEGIIEQRDGRYFPASQKNEAPDAMSVEDTSEASITDEGNLVSYQPSAQGREADVPGDGT